MLIRDIDALISLTAVTEKCIFLFYFFPMRRRVFIFITDLQEGPDKVSTQLMEMCWVKWMGRMSGFHLGSVQLTRLHRSSLVLCSSYTTAALRGTANV